MSTVTPDLDQLAEQVQYLTDRTAISDLLYSFARCIDTKDWKGYANNFTEDGVVEIPVKLPDGSWVKHVGREGMAEFVEGSKDRPGLGQFVVTHHLSSNHQVTIDGDTATTTSYAQCIHRFNDDLAKIWELGGWYTCEMRKTDDGWKFTHVHLDKVWEHGKPDYHG